MPPKGKTATAALEPLENLREIVATGDNGARDAEVETAIDKIGSMAEGLDLGDDEGKVVDSLAHYLLELFKHRPKPWDQLSQSEQRDLFAQLRNNAKDTVRIVVEAVARHGREPIRAMLESYSEKDGIKVTLKVKPQDEDEALAAVVGLHKAQGHNVLITVASADQFDSGSTDPSQPEQNELGFEAGTDEHPEDNSDLSDAAEFDPLLLKDGDAVEFAGEKGCVRVDVKRGWVEFLADDEDVAGGDWQDMREATPAELAAERERTADFASA